MGQYATQLLRLIREYRLDRHADMAQLRAIIESGRVNERQARMYLPLVEQRVQHEIDHPNYLHRPPEADEFYAHGKPEVEMGSLSDTDLRFGLDLLKGPRHLVTAGTTGSGKTTAMRGLSVGAFRLAQERNMSLSQVVFDRKGGEYGDLPGILGPSWLHLSAYDGMRLGLNAPGIPSDVWISIVSTILAVHLGLVASTVCLANVLRFLVAVLNSTKTTAPLWPDLRLVLEVLKRSPLGTWASKAEYGKTLVQALEGIVQASGALTQTLNGFDINRDVIDQGRSVVIEMSNLEPPALRSIFIDVILAQLFFSRIHRHHLVDTTEALLLIDEADEDVSRDADAAYPRRMSVINRVLKQGRELGIMAAIGVTLLGKTSDYVLSGAQYHLIFNQPDADSMRVARRTLALHTAAEQMFPALHTGQAIFRQAKSEWPHPVKCQVDHYPPRRTPPPEAYDRLPFVPSQTLDELPHVRAALDELVSQYNERKLRLVKRSSGNIAANARKLLDMASLHAYMPVPRLWDRLDKTSGSVQRAARQNLEKFKLAKFHVAQIGSAKVLLMEIETAGWKLLGKSQPKGLGRGGIAHRHFAHWINQVGRRRGFKSELEWNIPNTNHPVDVAWPVGERWRVFEVSATCRENLESHVRTCLTASDSIEGVTVVTDNKSTLRNVQHMIQDAFILDVTLDHVSFESIEPYFKELFG